MGVIIGFFLIVGVVGMAITSPLRFLKSVLKLSIWLAVIGFFLWALFSYTKYFLYAFLVLFVIGGIVNLNKQLKIKKKIQQFFQDGSCDELVLELSRMDNKNQFLTLNLVREFAEKNGRHLGAALDVLFRKSVELKIIGNLENSFAVDSDFMKVAMKGDIKIYSKLSKPPDICDAMKFVAEEIGLEVINLKSEKGKDVV